MLSAAQDKQTIYILWRCCKQVVFNEALNDQTSSILDQLNLPSLSSLSKWTQFLVIVNEHNFAAREYYMSLFGCTCNKILILNHRIPPHQANYSAPLEMYIAVQNWIEFPKQNYDPNHFSEAACIIWLLAIISSFIIGQTWAWNSLIQNWFVKFLIRFWVKCKMWMEIIYWTQFTNKRYNSYAKILGILAYFWFHLEGRGEGGEKGQICFHKSIFRVNLFDYTKM